MFTKYHFMKANFLTFFLPNTPPPKAAQNVSIAEVLGLDAQLIAGKSSSEFEKILGYADDSEMIHRDNMVLI